MYVGFRSKRGVIVKTLRARDALPASGSRYVCTTAAVATANILWLWLLSTFGRHKTTQASSCVLGSERSKRMPGPFVFDRTDSADAARAFWTLFALRPTFYDA